MKTNNFTRKEVVMVSLVLMMVLQIALYTEVDAQLCGTYFPRGGAQGGGYASGGDAQSAGIASVTVTAGWNLISNPVLNALPGDSVTQLFPISSFPYAFTYVPGSGYQQRFRMENGPGFWAKFPGAATQELSGSPLTADSIPITTGWNLVGSISGPVDTGTITFVPPGLRLSAFFGFSGGYHVASQILPAKAYFVKTVGPGLMYLSAPIGRSVTRARTRELPLTDRLNSITIADANGGRQTLYFGPQPDGNVPAVWFDMPPVPPEGTLDARFEGGEGGRLIEFHAVSGAGAVELPLSIRGGAHPMTISWDVSNGDYELASGEKGSAFGTQEMRGRGSTTIGTGVSRLIIRVGTTEPLPANFSLSQNYPNPFNPLTILNYELPVDCHVVVKVYDMLGREVAVLAEGTQRAGYRSVAWDASGASSGVYFCRLQAGAFTGIRKMIVAK